MSHSQLPAGHIGIPHAAFGRLGVTGVCEEVNESVNQGIKLQEK